MDRMAVPRSQLDAPYAERWELLKPVMSQLYIDEKKKLKDIVKIMAAEYKFFASENQYKRQFGLWNVSKVLTSKKKEKITKVLQTRSRQGKDTTVTYNGQDGNKKMRRYLKTRMRSDVSLQPSISLGIENLFGHALQCGNRLFMNWNTSPAVWASLKSKAINQFSPGVMAGTPMSGVQVFTPSSDSVPSPGHQHAPSSVNNKSGHDISSMMLVAHDTLAASRADIFLTKDHMALLGGMNLQEQIITTDWLHQFWQFSFRTARTWGRGPRVWDSNNLGLERHEETNTQRSPNTTALHVDSPSTHSNSQSPYNRTRTSLGIETPSSECRWSIHIREIIYSRISSPPITSDVLVDLDNEDTWTQWSTRESIENFAESLEKNIENNDFSNIDIKDLPMAANQIARALKRTPEQLLVEAFGFSIMARNLDLINDMTEKIAGNPDLHLENLFPLHLAASYLDGSKTCCQVFDMIVMGMTTGETSVRKLYTNHLNHTVLDTLMIAILKAHTSCVPGMVDEAFKREHRFAGEEVDVCGRWDADSDCIRQLQAHGNPTIPRNWKHMFCHTSVQTMIHCIGTLFGPHWAPDINTPSGIFLKRCLKETCGMKMQLKPLHTLVVTAVLLAQYGRDGETLFGILACLLCLLSKGANPLLKAEISLRALLTDDYGQECSHSELDPLELAKLVPETLISQWPQERRTGWNILCHVLELSQNEWKPQPNPEKVADSPTTGFQTIYSDLIEVDGGDNVDDESQALDVSANSDTDTELDFFEAEEREYEEDNGTDLPAYCPEIDQSPGHQNYFRKSKYLSTVWAAVQAELSTYRRIREEDSWISKHFSMESLLESLETDRPLSIGMISKNLMGPFCRCGIFDESYDVACVHREEACSLYFSNMEDWNRTTFIRDNSGRCENWYR